MTGCVPFISFAALQVSTRDRWAGMQVSYVRVKGPDVAKEIRG